jgi:hypothetical protein
MFAWSMSQGLANHPVVSHSFEPADPWEVDTPHGRGIVLYVTVYGAYANDLFCVANKEDGRIRHYQTDQISLCTNYTMNVHVPPGTPLHLNGDGRPAAGLNSTH